MLYVANLTFNVVDNIDCKNRARLAPANPGQVALPSRLPNVALAEI